MVFVTIGSSHFGFRRLIAEVDRLASRGVLSDVFAQVGNTAYQPRNCAWKQFLTPAEFQTRMQQADFMICHAGCGTLEEGMRLGKKMIVMPRRLEFAEAPDDHQMEILRLLSSSNRVLIAYEVDQLVACVQQVYMWTPARSSARVGNPVAEYIEEFIVNNLTYGRIQRNLQQ